MSSNQVNIHKHNYVKKERKRPNRKKSNTCQKCPAILYRWHELHHTTFILKQITFWPSLCRSLYEHRSWGFFLIYFALVLELLPFDIKKYIVKQATDTSERKNKGIKGLDTQMWENKERRIIHIIHSWKGAT